VLFDNGPVGVNVATFVVELYVTVAGTTALVPVFLRTMFVDVIVAGSIASLKVTCTVAFVATLVALFAGDTLVTVGGVVSSVANVQVLLAASPLPAASFAPVVIVTV
jgi:hypothetical protein